MRQTDVRVPPGTRTLGLQDAWPRPPFEGQLGRYRLILSNARLLCRPSQDGHAAAFAASSLFFITPLPVARDLLAC
jgi:hypothetical protein